MGEVEDDLHALSWSSYQIHNTQVFLTCRPDRVSLESVTEFINRNKPVARFQFTDDWVELPVNGPPWHWFPWVPGKNIPIENVFAFIVSMDRIFKQCKDGQSIWLHCDSSTMRAPTYFGLYLRAIHGDNVAQTTVDERKSFDTTWIWSSPYQYSETSMKLDPGIKELITTWQTGGEEAAYRFYMDYEEIKI